MSVSEVKTQLKQGSHYNGAYITSQAYGRLIPILVAKLIDSYLAGIYIYAKNIANTASQFVVFSRRVEFAGIIQMIQDKKFDPWTILLRQKLSLFIVCAFLLFSLLVFVALHFYDKGHYLLIAQVTLILIGILLLWALASALGQALVALERTGHYALTISLTLAISLLVILSSIKSIGLDGVYLGESLMFILQIVIFSNDVRKQSKLSRT